jgi:hypothetical protein
MLVFYSKSEGKPDVPAKSPADEPVENVLEIFRDLNPHTGFLGIILKEPFVLQMMRKKKGIRIELLDSSIPAFDSCEGAGSVFAEQLIIAAGNGDDVFQIAREKVPAWEHLNMS